MQTLISWQEFSTRFDSLLLAAAGAMWWFGVLLSGLSLLAVLCCILRWYSGAGEHLILPSGSEFLGFGHALKRRQTSASIAEVFSELTRGRNVSISQRFAGKVSGQPMWRLPWPVHVRKRPA
jgi:hypothetical protein